METEKIIQMIQDIIPFGRFEDTEPVISRGDVIKLINRIKEVKNMEQQEVPRELSESIKLIRNSRGYGWEIRILSTDIDRVEELNIKMFDKFGDGSQ